MQRAGFYKHKGYHFDFITMFSFYLKCKRITILEVNCRNFLSNNINFYLKNYSTSPYELNSLLETVKF